MEVPNLLPLDTTLVLPKPIETAPEDVVVALEQTQKLVIERKRNGHNAPIAITGDKDFPVGIYSRSMNTLTEKFPHHYEELRSMNIPAGTLLQGEFTLTDNGTERPGLITKIAGSRVERAVAIQEEIGIPSLSFFNVLVYKGRSVVHLSYQDRLGIIHELCRTETPHIGMVEVLKLSLEEAKQRSIARDWEGLVLYDKDAPTDYTFTGKSELPPRPYGCWKWKDYLESDFVVTGWVPSTSAKFSGLVKDLLIAQYNPTTGDLESWGKVGVGLTHQQRRELTDSQLYPMVVEVKFEARTPNKRLLSARVMRLRDDKLPHECVAPY